MIFKVILNESVLHIDASHFTDCTRQKSHANDGSDAVEYHPHDCEVEFAHIRCHCEMTGSNCCTIWVTQIDRRCEYDQWSDNACKKNLRVNRKLLFKFYFALQEH